MSNKLAEEALPNPSSSPLTLPNSVVPKQIVDHLMASTLNESAIDDLKAFIVQQSKELVEQKKEASTVIADLERKIIMMDEELTSLRAELAETREVLRREIAVRRAAVANDHAHMC